MPSLDFTTVQPSLQTHLGPLGAQNIIHAKSLPNPWKQSRFSKHLKLYTTHLHVKRGKLIIAAVATLETKSPIQNETKQRDPLELACSNSSTNQNESITDEDVEQVDVRERLRRTRISNANRGHTPWNKGRKHSPETLQKIRERTKSAMQNPKVKMKLASLGHAQSVKTRLKIGEGVRLRWERRKEMKKVQEGCHYDWQNLIAEAARRGSTNEAELQWDSYKIMDERLYLEWLERIEQRKVIQGAKGTKRVPKSLEQRKKIAEAIAAKWADPAYRERVCSGFLKYHGVPDGTMRHRRKTSSIAEPRRRSPAEKNTRYTENSSGSEHWSQIQLFKLKRPKTPVYKDPLASSKLDMIKSIKAKRAAEKSKKTEAIERARLLIAEAEKAAKALELAVIKTPVAQASLLESRKLIAEATTLIESIESRDLLSEEDETCSSLLPNQPTSLVELNLEPEIRDTNKQKPKDINGAHMLPFSMNKDSSSIKVNGNRENLPSNTRPSGTQPLRSESTVKQSVCAKQLNGVEGDRVVELGTNPHRTQVLPTEPNKTIELVVNPVPNGTKHQSAEENVAPLRSGVITRKWVRGRLVEVTETF